MEEVRVEIKCDEQSMNLSACSAAYNCNCSDKVKRE